MSLLELFVIAAGLSMDAFAVSVLKGLSLPKMSLRHAVITGLYFGGFQAFMPLLGYVLGSQFKNIITSVDHWIAFFLLYAIGINMIRESRRHDDDDTDCSLAPGNMIMLAIATSIDALAVGVTFAFLQVKILPAVSFIGTITFLLSMAGVKTGNVFGIRYKSRAELFGGGILLIMGLKILVDGWLSP